MTAADLHDQDFYLWTQAQAAALRAFSGGRAAGDTIDYENLAGTLEEIGQTNLAARLVGARAILELLIKLAAGRRRGKYGGWRATIIVRRAELRMGLTVGLRARISAELPKLHAQSQAAVEAAFAKDEPEALPIEPGLEWTLEEILGERNDPLS